MGPRLPFSDRVFDPTGEELIGHYLKNHILRQPYLESGTIQEATVFGENINPWDKFCDDHEPYPWLEAGDSGSLFLFTRLTNVGNTSKSSNIQKNRKAGDGTWHGTRKVVNVVGEDNTIVGPSKVLSFRSLNGEETKGQWTMYEYGISGEAFPEVRGISDWQNQVVCRIKRDDTKSSVGGKVTKRKSPSTSSLPNKRSRTAPNALEEEKLEYVSQQPADQLCYGEVTDPNGMSLEELFEGVEVELPNPNEFDDNIYLDDIFQGVEVECC